MKIYGHALSFLLLVSSSAFPRTFQTISNGFWNDSLNWFSYAVPSYSTSDTVLIEDSIRFESDINLYAGALIQIDSGGGLCGHFTINAYGGSSVINAGYLELDSFMLTGGSFLNINYGLLKFSKIMKASNGGTI